MNSGHIEEISCRRLEQAFRAAFDDVVMMPNLVISLTNGPRLPTDEIDPVRGKPCRLGQGQERGRQSRPCVCFSAVSVVAQCTGE